MRGDGFWNTLHAQTFLLFMILSAAAIIIVALIPLALRGVPYRAVGAARLLRDNLLIYGLGGLIVPFIGIKVIDMIVSLIIWKK